MPPRLCLAGCGRLTTATRCEPCRLARQRRRDAARGSAAARGYDAAWRRVVAAAIAEQPWCTYCGATEDLTGDHVIPLAAGGTSDPSNVVVACRPCNSTRGARRRL